MPKTKSFRVATSGATIDGRTIDPQTLQEMAETYNPATYQARVNLEHYMSMSPDSSFGAYGDVLALRTEPVTLNVGGQDEQRMGLYAEIDAHDSLVALKEKKQKLFTSIEVTPNFGGTGKAYLSGLAFTDSPASLGTEAMKFRSTVGEVSPFRFTAAQKDALFTPPIETTFDFATPVGLPGPDPDEQTNGIMDAIRRALRGFAIVPEKAAPVIPAVVHNADPAVAAAFTDLGKVMATFATTTANQAKALDKVTADFAAHRAETDKLRAELSAANEQIALHKAALEKVTPASFKHRPAATGGGGDQSVDPKDEIL